MIKTHCLSEIDKVKKFSLHNNLMSFKIIRVVCSVLDMPATKRDA